MSTIVISPRSLPYAVYLAFDIMRYRGMQIREHAN